MKFTKIFCLTFLFLLFGLNANAQNDVKSTTEKNESTQKSAEDIKWKRIETEDKEFSMLMPENFSYFLDERGYTAVQLGTFRSTHYKLKNLRSLTGFQSGVSMWFESVEVKNPEKAFPAFLFYSMPRNGKITDYRLENSTLRQIIVENPESYAAHYYFYSDERIYYIGVGARDKSNKVITDFISSIFFQGKNLFKNESENNILIDSSVILEKLAETPLEIVYNKDAPKKIKTKKETVIGNVPEISGEKKLVILTTISPSYTEQARTGSGTGDILVKLKFGDTGQIQHIEVGRPLKDGLTENAITTARRIRFLPPEKNDKAYSTVRLVQFKISIY